MPLQADTAWGWNWEISRFFCIKQKGDYRRTNICAHFTHTVAEGINPVAC